MAIATTALISGITAGVSGGSKLITALVARKKQKEEERKNAQTQEELQRVASELEKIEADLDFLIKEQNKLYLITGGSILGGIVAGIILARVAQRRR